MLEVLSGLIADACGFLRPAGVTGVFGGVLVIAAVLTLLCRGAYGKTTAVMRRVCRLIDRGDTNAALFRREADKLPPELKADWAKKNSASLLFYIDSRFRAGLFSHAGGCLLLLSGALCPVLYLTLSALLGLSAAVSASASLLLFVFGALLSLCARVITALHYARSKRRCEPFSACAYVLSPPAPKAEPELETELEPEIEVCDCVQSVSDDTACEPPLLRYTPYVFEGYGAEPEIEDIIGRIGGIAKTESPMHEMQAIAALLREERYQPENKTPNRKRTLDEAYKKLLDAVREHASGD